MLEPRIRDDKGTGGAHNDHKQAPSVLVNSGTMGG